MLTVCVQMACLVCICCIFDVNVFGMNEFVCMLWATLSNENVSVFDNG